MAVFMVPGGGRAELAELAAGPVAATKQGQSDLDKAI